MGQTISNLNNYINTDGLPIMDTESFVEMTNSIGKEQFRLDLAEYIANNRPKYPFKKISLDDISKLFTSLKEKDIWDYLTPKEDLKKLVAEKYNDYKYPFDKYGLGIISCSHNYNDISNYFHRDLRLNCSSYGFKAPLDVWNNGDAKDIWRILGPVWRGINKKKNLIEDTYISAIRLQTYVATQFKPNVAKTIYQMTNAKKVLDTSCGWGDRLAGFFTSDAEEYIGCDPNPNTYERYMKQIETYNSFLPKPKKVKIYRCGAEDLPWHKIKDIDCAFTSPPYFSTEEYNKNGKYQEDQSWFKYKNYSGWANDFFLPVAKNTFNSLSDKGHMLVNIMDPKVKNIRYRSCDELVDSLKDYFTGQIGMRISRRPKSNKLFKDEQEKKQFSESFYIENIWCFTKDKDFDYFRLARKATLY